MTAGRVYRIADRNTQTALLREAVHKKNAVLVRALLAKGADPNAPYVAPPLGFADMLRVAFHLSRPHKSGSTIFMHAAVSSPTPILQSLLEAGGNIHDQTASGATALNMAARDTSWYPKLNGNLVFLVEHGADINHADNLGETPLYAAANNPQDLAFLIAHGADPNRPNRVGNTPLVVASAMGNPVTLQALLQAGADIQSRNVVGVTALMDAADAGEAKTVFVLLKSGADPTLRDQTGHTAEDYAKSSNHPALARMIHQYRPQNAKK
ncbi:MAG: Ankyrin [Chthonomonadales bacterium]|nr:Ankyrin [Chthonomonadales bacterium]